MNLNSTKIHAFHCTFVQLCSIIYNKLGKLERTHWGCQLNGIAC